MQRRGLAGHGAHILLHSASATALLLGGLAGSLGVGDGLEREHLLESCGAVDGGPFCALRVAGVARLHEVGFRAALDAAPLQATHRVDSKRDATLAWLHAGLPWAAA